MNLTMPVLLTAAVHAEARTRSPAPALAAARSKLRFATSPAPTWNTRISLLPQTAYTDEKGRAAPGWGTAHTRRHNGRMKT